MDGLMLDTEPGYRLAWSQATAECGFMMSDTVHSRLTGRTRADGEQVLLDEFGDQFPLDAFREACRRCESMAWAANPPRKKPGLDGLLDLLDSRRMPKAVATSTERLIAVPQLAATGLLDRFDVVATGDEVTRGKPFPDLFLLAALRLGVVPAACLVLEDSEPGVIAAHSAGMQVYIVPDLKQLSPAIKRLANGTFDSLDAVARQLELDGKIRR